MYNSYYSACMKSSEKIGKVSTELNVKYETVHGLTYKKKVQATSSEDPQYHFTAVHFVQNRCTDYLMTAQSFELLTSDSSDVLTGSPTLALRGKHLFEAAGSVISLQWIRQIYMILSYQPVKLYNDALMN